MEEVRSVNLLRDPAKTVWTSLTREGFKVIFLPPNVTSIIQPMDQSIIEAMKRNYWKQLLCQLLLRDSNDKKMRLTVITFLKSIDLEEYDLLLLHERHKEPELATEVLDTFESLKVTEDGDREDVLKWLNKVAKDEGYLNIIVFGKIYTHLQ
ncbi:hypothetical protein ILUMI_17622 [Ignelater luminosus]|uniref:DDE-1 domain-containing protein n=1 Tax=Ignelater luminosus TaxID=2038154 RepID=A0A8K0CP48_IGNLU|nr:hypothetical protein ILUMI_17622 [Ignelater luminosus]